MLKINITLKSFDYHYIKKNVSFFNQIYLLLNRNSSINFNEALVSKKHSFLQTQLEKSINTSKVKKTISNCAKKRIVDSFTTVKKTPAKQGLLGWVEKQPFGLEFFKQNLSGQKNNKIIFQARKTRVLQDFKQISFPKKNKLFTVLQSPHVDKKSREQFYFTTHTKKLAIQFRNIKHVVFFLFLLKNAELYGVETEISFCYTSAFIF